MPELPEVETVRRGLAELVNGDTIVDVQVTLPRIIRYPSVTEFVDRASGRTIRGIGRRGKYLLFDLAPYTLVSHLRMEGQYRVVPTYEPVALHSHVIFRLASGRDLRYRDVRQFGTMDLLLPDESWPSGLRALGPEPFDPSLTPAALRRSLAKRTAPVKAVLLDQTVIAGLGNIYVDEALFLSGIHPLEPTNRIGPKRLIRLLAAVRDVLGRAIDAGGSSIRTYQDGYGRHGGFQIQLNVYGRTGEPCCQCGREIQRIRIGGRGTHYCPHCQRPGRTSRVAAKPEREVGR
ncbi:formamidopyrimidine-DNA glycosylase [Alicyclobacillus sacchari]|uniref:bifunctional DNA-formamidopyrimidine glycosylase/DNA-(apurinic or apyrimidinic site) lyase n=1 Tax=Alicyclobacillus sacchari TaxID=392010 RepID=UPI0023E949A2|nr:bifunctional DNA-formamidopyrimidine glycosylase/DNA-(apurinic or apyrimidinic site) lyase [Alicyclobacillus sacchari]GMA56581.1 formamidopyrimidine-DNA glycosylase [Alicyclobacillus sacchari]